MDNAVSQTRRIGPDHTALLRERSFDSTLLLVS